jgi:uncharacterized protein (DUF58 family)
MLLRPLGIVALAGLCYLAAQGTGQRLFFHLTYLLIGLLFVALAWAWLNVRGLQVERETLAQRAHVGEYARERIAIRNRWPFPKLWVELQDRSDMPEHGAGFVTSLGPHKRGRWLARTLCTARGRFTLGPSTIVSGDPFGIWRVSRTFPATNEIIVYPQLVDLPEFSLPSAELPGGQDTRARSYNVTPNVASLREYAPCDSFNRIHWRSTARTGRLMVKEFELDPSADVYIVLDMQERTVVTDLRQVAGRKIERPRPSFWWQRPPEPKPANERVYESTEEYGVVAAASIARALLARNRIVGMVAWGQHREIIPAERESRQLFKILEALAILRAYGTESLAEVLVAESQRFSRNSTLVIITSSTDERWLAALQQQLYRGLRAVVVFVDPLSFGGWYDPAPIINHLVELRVPVYRVRQGESIANALREPMAVGKIAA